MFERALEMYIGSMLPISSPLKMITQIPIVPGKMKRQKKSKIVVIKNCALPKLIYPLTSLPNPPRETIKHLENIMFNFLWDGKPDKIKRQLCKTMNVAVLK